jgi:hypothetical protein
LSGNIVAILKERHELGRFENTIADENTNLTDRMKQEGG